MEDALTLGRDELERELTGGADYEGGRLTTTGREEIMSTDEWNKLKGYDENERRNVMK